MANDWKRIGIIGGLGPLACGYFYVRLVGLTEAKSDEEHPEVLLISNPEIPSRLGHLLSGGPSPIPSLQHVARRLEDAGAEIIAMPSITTQAYHREVALSVSVPVVNMLAAVARSLRSSGVQRPSLAMTDGARQANLFHEALTREGLAPNYPDDATQHRIQECVGLVKEGQVSDAQSQFRTAVSGSWTSAGDALVIGCTDLSPLLPDLPAGAHDVSQIYAREVLNLARIEAGS